MPDRTTVPSEASRTPRAVESVETAEPVKPADSVFDVREIPFSRSGSWLNLSPVVALHTASDVIHLVSHTNGLHGVLALRPERNGEAVDARWAAEPSCFRWTAAGGVVEAVFAAGDALRLRGSGMGMRITDAAANLTPFTGTFLFIDPVDDAAVFTSYETGRRYRVTLLSGQSRVFGAEALGATERSVLLGGDGSDWEAEIREMTSHQAAATSATTFDVARSQVADDFGRYVHDIAPWRSDRTPAAVRAAYVMWSATVAPAGFVTRESVLMSKHWMDRVWSWDHCFNALALAAGRPNAAVDQFLAPFDHQDDRGALPDSITHSEILFNYVKPPIHGWALRRMRANMSRNMTGDELETVYGGLARWSRFWLGHRRRPGHALPYYQHGNDSGWDNSTTFDIDRVIEAPDLAAFLAVQLQVLAELADELGHPSAEWRDQSQLLVEALLAELWTGSEFVAVGALSGRQSTATSLVNLMPLVLGERLPADIRATLAQRVVEHLTEYGLATEPVASPHYEDDGYWRGPIWAPSTALIEDGLRSSGYPDLADDVSARWRALCERSGFAENFDARTGAGLRDRAYTWTASVYLSLAAAHARNR